MKYILVTPSKNEENNISDLIKRVMGQTIRPCLWVIADESSDGTKEIIEEVAEENDWIKAHYLGENDEYLGINYAAACKFGFDHAIDYCKDEGIEYDYIGLLDADVAIESDFFEQLMSLCEKEPEVGIASGTEYWDIAGELVSAGTREDLPMGPVRIWRKECFYQTGGYEATASPDSVSIVKARLKGWQTKQFKELKVVVRETSTAKGYWWGAVREGKNKYFVGYHPAVIVLKSLKSSFKKPYYTGIGLFLGYFGSLIHREEMIDDDEIKYYYKHTRPKELFRNYVDILKGKGE